MQEKWSFRKINDLIEEIAGDGIDYAPEVDFETGEILTPVITTEDELAKALGDLEMEREVKVENIAVFCQKLKAKSVELETEIQRLKAWQNAIKARRKWLMWYCVEQMKRAGLTKVTGKFVKVSVRKSPVSATYATYDGSDIPNPSEIHHDFWYEETTIKVDKKKAIRHFKDTGEVPKGFVFHTENSHLHIG